MRCATVRGVNGQRWRDAREAAGKSGPDAVYEVRSKLPERYWISTTKLSHFERDRPGTTIDPHALAVLADLYGRVLADLDPAAAAELDALGRWRKPDGGDTIVTYSVPLDKGLTIRRQSRPRTVKKRAAA